MGLQAPHQLGSCRERALRLQAQDAGNMFGGPRPQLQSLRLSRLQSNLLPGTFLVSESIGASVPTLPREPADFSPSRPRAEKPYSGV